MTSEPVVGVVFGRLVVGKTTLSYICLPFHSPTQVSQALSSPELRPTTGSDVITP